MADTEVVREIVDRLEVRAKGHFQLASGLHSEVYFDKDQIGASTCDLDTIAEMLSDDMNAAGLEIDAVVSPATGAISFGTMFAYVATSYQVPDAYFVYVEKDGKGGFRIRPNMLHLVKGKRVAIAEDIFTSGGSANKVIQVVREAGGDVVCVVGMINRGGVTAETFGVKHFFVALDVTDEKPQTWTPAQCEIDGPCSRGIPMSDDLGKTAKGKN